jgi:hypothetical protein
MRRSQVFRPALSRLEDRNLLDSGLKLSDVTFLPIGYPTDSPVITVGGSEVPITPPITVIPVNGSFPDPEPGLT